MAGLCGPRGAAAAQGARRGRGRGDRGARAAGARGGVCVYSHNPYDLVGVRRNVGKHTQTHNFLKPLKWYCGNAPTQTPLEWKSHRLPAWFVCVCVPGRGRLDSGGALALAPEVVWTRAPDWPLGVWGLADALLPAGRVRPRGAGAPPAARRGGEVPAGAGRGRSAVTSCIQGLDCQ